MGYWTTDSDVVVTHASGPGREARHGFLTFERAHAAGQLFIDRVFEESGGLLTYLGEWHTHPWGRLTPSARDLQTMRAIPLEPRAYQPQPILVIHAGPWSRFWPQSQVQAYVLFQDKLMSQRLYLLHLSVKQILTTTKEKS